MIIESYVLYCISCNDHPWDANTGFGRDELKCPSCGSQGEVCSQKVTVRGKGMFAQSDSIEEIVERLKERAEYLQELDKEGYELVDGGDDYWILQIPVEELSEKAKPNIDEGNSKSLDQF